MNINFIIGGGKDLATAARITILKNEKPGKTDYYSDFIKINEGMNDI
jgi:hypothetical protein